MIIVETCTFTLGIYTVQQRPRPDNPAFAVFLISRSGKLIGKQFSRPCESDCQWLERENGVYARSSREMDCALTSGVRVWILETRLRGGESTRRRGRPRKDEAQRELQEATAS